MTSAMIQTLTPTLTREDQIALVTRYFDAVDGEDLPALLATLTPNCVFSVETHGVRLEGHDQIAAMFTRLWAEHAAVLHHKFTYVPDPEGGGIAARFTVQNTEHDGSLTHKSNCNFFEITRDETGAHFATVRVYMTGANTLKDDA